MAAALWIFALLCVSASVWAVERCPAYANRDSGQLLLVPSIEIGSPEHERLFVFSGSAGHGLVLMTDPDDFSSTAVAGREMVRIAGNEIWLPYVVSPAYIGSYNIENSQNPVVGVLSLDRASQLWSRFKCVRIGLDGLSFPSCDSTPRALRWVDCDPLATGMICRVPGTVQGTPVIFEFTFDKGISVIPGEVFYSYIGSNNVQTAPRHWNDLQFEIGGTTVRLPPKHILSSGWLQTQKLTIAPGASGVVRVGQETVRSMTIYYNAFLNRIAIEQTDTNWTFSWYSSIGIIIGMILFVKALMEPFTFRPHADLPTVKHYILESFGVTLPIASMLNWNVWGIFIDSHLNVAFMVLSALHMIFYVVFTGIGLYGLLRAPSAEFGFTKMQQMQMAAFRRFSVRGGLIFSVIVFAAEVRTQYLYAMVPDFIMPVAIGGYAVTFAATMAVAYTISDSTDYAMIWNVYVALSILLFVPTMIVLSAQVIWPLINLVVTQGGPRLALVFTLFMVICVIMFTSKVLFRRTRLPFELYNSESSDPETFDAEEKK